MQMYDLLNKKKKKESLTEEEIKFIVKGYTAGQIPDYQMSAFLMAVCINGMNHEETAALTLAMAESGDMLDLSAIRGVKVDKHSTGGVGDKTSLILGPMVAALGIPVAKMSGRGLGHTGGTIDKLESFPGFSTSISSEEFIEQVNRIHIAIVGQTANLAPADKKIYALRDVTATVDNISLIASSIMSKKLASGSEIIVLDVKTGSGAFMKNYEDALALAKEMVQIGTIAGRTTFAIITDMNQPLGNTIGNTLEVEEAIESLKGEGPADLMAVSLTLAAYMLLGAEKAENIEQARKMLEDVLVQGKALDKMAEFVEAQGGSSEAVYHPETFTKAKMEEQVYAEKEGYVNSIHTEEIGITAMLLGGGRQTKDSEIDLTVGIRLHKKLGDRVNQGEALATLYANDPEKLETAKKRFLAAYGIEDKEKERLPYIYAVVTKDGLADRL